MKLLLLLLAAPLLALPALAATNTAANPSYTAVAATIAASSNGDTILIPAGTATWLATLTVTKAVNLEGAGTNSTLITINVPNPGGDISTCGLNFRPSATATISGIKWIGATGYATANPAVFLNSTSELRITSCVFSNCAKGLVAERGVADHCVFANNQGGVRVVGESCEWWTNLYPIPFDSTNYFFVEDSAFTTDANMTGLYGSDHAWVSSGQGSSYIVRHCNFEWSQDNFAPGFDWHGDNNDGTRGNLSSQIYANTFTASGTGTINKFVDGRGGQSLVYSNVVNILSDGINFREEYPAGTFACGVTCFDSVTNAWNWANFHAVSTPMLASCDAGCGSITFSNAAPVTLLAPPYPHPLASSQPTPPVLRVLRATTVRAGSVGVP